MWARHPPRGIWDIGQLVVPAACRLSVAPFAARAWRRALFHTESVSLGRQPEEIGLFIVLDATIVNDIFHSPFQIGRQCQHSASGKRATSATMVVFGDGANNLRPLMPSCGSRWMAYYFGSHC